ncbi:hypothetical protein LVD17_15055 [Fulvivirga ulvae]|uniref:hypothetical protein n=1 Tax=Fulvivirga ulvae TaxID=2904245 RepID=UPI001F16B98F|nr:hypothetical protein [Fulvivirga ulvae]UII29617.1 hypothetical protein LVD17_15055 [Fulvivirga ulvae]
MDVLFEEDMEWIATDWNPKVMAAGVRYIALVTPENDSGAISQETYIENSENSCEEGLTIRQFEDIGSAKEWLREVLNNE